MSIRRVIALFGEAQRGPLRMPHTCRSLSQLLETFGHPPSESQGLFLAIQALLYKRELIFCRVTEEGYSVDDYLAGLNILANPDKNKRLHALCLPGVGSKEIIDATYLICDTYKSLLILSEKDLYDYLTESN